MLFHGPGVHLSGSAEDEQLELILDLHHQGLAADAHAFAPGPGRFCRGVRGLMVDVTVGDGVFLEEVFDELEVRCFHSYEKEMKIEKCKVKN